MSGHVFVMRGDVMGVACDAWLTPGGFRPGRTWRAALAPRDAWPEPELSFGRGGPRVMPWPALDPRAPQPFLTFVVGDNRAGAEWYVDGAREFVRVATAHVRKAPPRHGRARHLLAVPLVGTGDGGAWHMAGDVTRHLLRALREEAAAHDVDIVLALWDGPAFAAAQTERLLDEDAAFAALPRELRAAADALAAKARAGDLVIFIGAGLSQGAGLPSWRGLLSDLAAARARVTDIPSFDGLGELDRAALIARRLGDDESLGALVSEHIRERSTHYALGHGLLASLPVEEVVTMNYDDLFERASAAVGRPVTVLPGGRVARGERWLLKMHGCMTRPESIVLTREDYLRFQANRSALAGIVQALLITRHMLFVGFSFSDDNFHRIAHAVREALREGGGMEGRSRFGTTLVVGSNPLARELWERDVDWIAFDQRPKSPFAEQPRLLEIFLDRVAARAATATSHLCDPRYEAVISPAERELRERLRAFAASAGEDIRGTPAWLEVQRLLRRLGSRDG